MKEIIQLTWPILVILVVLVIVLAIPEKK